MTEIYPLCDFDELPDPGARDFTIATKTHPLDIFIVRKGRHIYAYLNSCPHRHVNLNWKPGAFHDHTGAYLQCTFHGATFRIEDGLCVQGPCIRQSLQALHIHNDNGKLSLILSGSDPEQGESS